MFDRDTLKARFDAAGVALRFARGPADFGVRPQRGIFLMDVRRVRIGRNRDDEFVLTHGDEDVDAHVVHVDRGLRQLILEVVEPERRFTVNRWDRNLREYVDEEHVTAASVRRLLVGHDEAHLFVCTLGANASSVREAHRKLAPSVFQSKRRRRTPRVRRQGEWFFVPVDDVHELDRVETRNLTAVARRRARIGSHLSLVGRPHLAEELVSLATDRGGIVEYVRGKVKHPDHRVLELKTWHRVHVNTEDRGARIEGMSWID